MSQYDRQENRLTRITSYNVCYTKLLRKMVLPLVVMQPESIQLVDEAMSKDRLIGLIVAKKPVEENIKARDHLNTVGTVGFEPTTPCL